MLPVEVAVAIGAITLAELAAGHTQPRTKLNALAVKTVFSERKPRSIHCRSTRRPRLRMAGSVRRLSRAAARLAGHEAVDLLVAAVACSASLPLHTRYNVDLEHLEDWVEVIEI